MKATPLPTRSVTRARTFAFELFSAPVTQTQPPSPMLRAAASAGLISTNISCCSSASQRLERVSSPPPSSKNTVSPRSEEHTSELQSLIRISYAVSCLYKKKYQYDKQTMNAPP